MYFYFSQYILVLPLFSNAICHEIQQRSDLKGSKNAGRGQREQPPCSTFIVEQLASAMYVATYICVSRSTIQLTHPASRIPQPELVSNRPISLTTSSELFCLSASAGETPTRLTKGGSYTLPSTTPMLSPSRFSAIRARHPFLPQRPSAVPGAEMPLSCMHLLTVPTGCLIPRVGRAGRRRRKGARRGRCRLCTSSGSRQISSARTHRERIMETNIAPSKGESES